MFKVELTEKANSRTKNRIKNHGPMFDSLEVRDIQHMHVADVVGSPAVLLRNIRWHGWIPLDQISWEEVSFVESREKHGV